MKFINNTYPYTLFNFDISNDTVIEYEDSKDNYFILEMFDNDFLTNKNKSYLEIESFEFFNENILKSFIELKYLYENQNAISNELLLIENKNNLHITFLKYYNRHHYFLSELYKNMYLLSISLICYYNLSENDNDIEDTLISKVIDNDIEDTLISKVIDNDIEVTLMSKVFNNEIEETLISEIQEKISDYFFTNYELHEIDDVEINFTQLAEFLDIDFYYNNKLDLYLPKKILYDTQTQSNTNADTETTGENQITETTGNYQITEIDLQLIKNARKIEIGYIIKKEFGGNRRTLCYDFVKKLKDKGLTINFDSIYSNVKSSYTPPNNFIKENKDFVNTIKNILK